MSEDVVAGVAGLHGEGLCGSGQDAGRGLARLHGERERGEDIVGDLAGAHGAEGSTGRGLVRLQVEVLTGGGQDVGEVARSRAPDWSRP